MNWKTVQMMLATMGLSMLYACASSTPQLDTGFGQTVSRATLQQTLNPDAGATVRPTLGLDGTQA